MYTVLKYQNEAVISCPPASREIGDDCHSNRARQGSYIHIIVDLDNILKSYSIDTPVEQLWKLINGELNSVIEKLVPSKTATTRFNQPWVNKEVRTVKRLKRRYYNKARRTHSPEDWKKYIEQPEKGCSQYAVKLIKIYVIEHLWWIWDWT